MNLPVTYANYESQKRTLSMLFVEPDTSRSDWLHQLMIMPASYFGSGGYSEFALTCVPEDLPVWSGSSFCSDASALDWDPLIDSPSISEFPTLTTADKLSELQLSLSLNKSQLAKILRVSRPTIYDWLAGRDANFANTQRLDSLRKYLAQGGVSSSTPIDARFVVLPVGLNRKSLLALLSEEPIEEGMLISVIQEATELHSTYLRRIAREEQLRNLGFDEPDRNQRKDQLARNIALKGWPST